MFVFHTVVAANNDGVLQNRASSAAALSEAGRDAALASPGDWLSRFGIRFARIFSDGLV
jgi:hypothetical protein